MYHIYPTRSLVFGNSRECVTAGVQSRAITSILTMTVPLTSRSSACVLDAGSDNCRYMHRRRHVSHVTKGSHVSWFPSSPMCVGLSRASGTAQRLRAPSRRPARRVRQGTVARPRHTSLRRQPHAPWAVRYSARSARRSLRPATVPTRIARRTVDQRRTTRTDPVAKRAPPLPNRPTPGLQETGSAWAFWIVCRPPLGERHYRNSSNGRRRSPLVKLGRRRQRCELRCRDPPAIG
jgi:hypothetical protein